MNCGEDLIVADLIAVGRQAGLSEDQITAILSAVEGDDFPRGNVPAIRPERVSE